MHIRCDRVSGEGGHDCSSHDPDRGNNQGAMHGKKAHSDAALTIEGLLKEHGARSRSARQGRSQDQK